jgi:hypothetical protein
MSEKGDEISLVDVYIKIIRTFTYLWSKKRSIVLVGIVGSSMGLLYAFLKPVEYKSKLTFIVDQAGANKGLGALGGIASSFGFGGLGGDGGLYENKVNLMGFIKSRSLIEKTLLQTIPGTHQTFADRFVKVYKWDEELKENPKLKNIHFAPNYQRESFSIAKDSVLFEIYRFIIENEKLEVEVPDDEGNIIAINSKFQNDTFANYFPKVLLNEVSISYVNAKTKLVKDNVQILQHQTDSVRKELNEALFNTAYQTDEVFGLNPAFNVKRVPANKEQIDVRASSVLLEELIKNLELAKVQLKDQTPLIEVIDEPRFPLEELKPGKLKMIVIFGVVFGTITLVFLLSLEFLKKLKIKAANSNYGLKQ